MLYELRIYEAVPGKLPAVHARFRDHTIEIWKKYGIKPTGFWTTAVGPSNQQLIYILEWQDMTHRERAWNSFVCDPEWLAVRAETEKDGPIVANVQNSFLSPTDYSAMK